MNVIAKIKEAGVVGAGGAGFPTHVKADCKAEYVIANGAECEPLLRVDQQIMEFQAAEVVQGIRAMMEATGAKKGVIALKSHYKKAIAALTKEIGGKDDVSIYQMKGYYPAGDEQQIVYEVTGKVVPTGGLPLDVGAVVSNVGTLVNVARALKGVPVTEKFVTVGGAVKTPKTVNVPVGTHASELIAMAGGVTEDCMFIEGGPCMGLIREDDDFYVTKTTGGILAIPVGHKLWAQKDDCLNLQRAKSVCCQCTMCTQMCPRNALGLKVEPHKAMRSVANQQDLFGKDVNGLFSCCDCGICTYYACNFGLKPHLVMRQMKAKLGEKGIKPQKEIASEVAPGFDYRKLPVSRMIGHMGIEAYNVPAPMEQQLKEVGSVRIATKMCIGSPSEPIVKKGQKVKAGQLVAKIKENALGANVHASVDGVVAEITPEWIEIRVNR